MHLGREEAEVLCDDVQPAELLLRELEKLVVRTFFPLPDGRVLVAEGNGIVALEAAEVVDADDVVQLRRRAYAPDP